MQEEQTPIFNVKESTSTPWSDAVQMDSAQRMVFDPARLAVLSSKYNRNGVPDNGTRSCPTNVGPSLYYGRWYEYVPGLVD